MKHWQLALDYTKRPLSDIRETLMWCEENSKGLACGLPLSTKALVESKTGVLWQNEMKAHMEECVGCLSGGAKIWLRRQKRLMLDCEMAALQGMYRTYGGEKGMKIVLQQGVNGFCLQAMFLALLSAGLL